MNLRWKAFEKSMQARVRPRDARRRMRFWQRVDHFLNSSPSVPAWLPRLLASLALVVLIGGASELRANPAFALAVLGVWQLWVAAFRAALWSAPGIDLEPGRAVLSLAPLSGDEVLGVLKRGLARGSMWTFGESLFVYAILVVGGQTGGYSWVAACLCAALQTAVSSALVVAMAASKVRGDWIFLPGFLGLPLVILCSAHLLIQPIFTLSLGLLNPFGWLFCAVFLNGMVDGAAWGGWGFLPAAGLVLAWSHSLRGLRQFSLESALWPSLPGRTHRFGEGPRRSLASSGCREAVLRGDFLRPLSWERLGWVERVLGRLLTARERLLAEWLLDGGAPWSRALVWALAWLVLYLIAAAWMPFRSPDEVIQALAARDPRLWAAGVAFAASFIFFCLLVARLLTLFAVGTNWPGLGRMSGRRSYTVFPASYWDTVLTTAKLNTGLLFLLLPVVLVLPFTPVSQLVLRAVPHAGLLPLKALVLVWGCAIGLPAFGLSPGIEEGVRYWRPTLIKLAVLAAGGALGLGLLGSASLVLDGVLFGVWIAGVCAWLGYSGAAYQRGNSP